MEIYILCLFLELLVMIFGYLDVWDKGCVVQVCIVWWDVVYYKLVWWGVEVKLYLCWVNLLLFFSLQVWGICWVQILSFCCSFSYVIQGMVNIESFNFSGCYNFIDNGLGYVFVQEIGFLCVFNLSFCKQIIDSSLGCIVQYFKGLEVLELGGCSNIINIGFLFIVWGLQCFKSFNFCSCCYFLDVGIGYLVGMMCSVVEGCLGLEQFMLQDCQKFIDFFLKYIF